MITDLRLEPDLSLASTLPARLYLDPATLALERERIFYRTWQWVAHRSRLLRDGDYCATSVLDQPLVLTREGQALRGFFNVCRHRAGPVALGEGNRRTLQCRYHGWTYGLDGGLRGTPEFTGARCFDRDAHGLLPVPLEEAAGLLFTNLAARGQPCSPQVPPLAAVLGEIVGEIGHLPLASMRPFHRVEYDIRCNWKVYVDNYLEGYHIPLVHPRLHRLLDYGAYREEPRRYHSRQHAPYRGEGEVQALYYWVFPNLMLNVYPDNLQLNLVIPTALDRTVTVFEWYLLDPDEPGAAERFAAAFALAEEVQREDMAICEQVQRGLASLAYDQGRLCPDREAGVHHFHRLWLEFMQTR